MKSQLVFLLVALSTFVNAQNLILNPDCELPLVNGKIPFWVKVVGAEWTKGSVDPTPQNGQSFFYPGDDIDAELTQTIPVDEYTCWIDQGNQGFQFGGYVRSYPQNPPDQSSIVIEMLSNTDALLKSQTFGPYSETTFWQPVAGLLPVPAQTRKIKIRLLSHRRTGTSNDGYFDNLSLTPISSGANIKIESISSLSASCNQADGALTVVASGGSGVRQYSLDGQPFQISNVFLNLIGGTYTVVVKDGGCTVSQSTTVGSTSAPHIDRIQPTDASCNQANGTLTVLASGGSGSRQYSLNSQPFQISNVFLNLVSGAYAVTVKDGGCTVSQSMTVGSTNVPRIDRIQATDASCNQANGALMVLASGGSGSRQYSLDGQSFQISNVFLNLTTGTYTVTVKDGGCTISQSATVVASVLHIDGIQPTDATCSQANGSLTVVVSGGSGIRLYSLDGQSFQISPTFLSLPGGVYTAIVKDGGCTISQSLTVGTTSVPHLDEIQLTGASCNQANGVLTVVASGGNGSRQYSIDNQLFQASPTFLNLSGGPYTVTVKDGGCTISQSVTVGTTSIPHIDRIQPTNATCSQANGALMVTVSGGSGSRQYSLDGQSFQTSPMFTNLSGGSYTVTVKDGGCTVSQSLTVGSTTAPHIDGMQPTNATCGQADGLLSVVATGGSGTKQYSLDGQSFQTSPTFLNLLGGSYTVTVKDETSCVVKEEVSILNSMDCYVYVPDVFSPNNDGVNDYFRFYSGKNINYTVRQLAIYDRWGEVVFSRENFPILDPDSTWWDGTFRGGKNQAGVYTYYFEYVDLKNVINHIRGAVILLR